jgi:uncharacterized protein (DUF58 family)
MLTRSAQGLILAGTTMVTLGLGTANPVLVGLSAIPLVAALVGVTETPTRVETATVDAPGKARAGEVVDVAIGFEFDDEPGLVVAKLDVPDTFEVVEGDTVRVVDTREDPDWHVKLRAGKRGLARAGPVHAAPLAETGIKAYEATPVHEGVDVEVQPRLVPVRRLESMRGTAATIAPEEDVAQVGLETTDFRELREYRPGDPPRAVNWKATARMGPAVDEPLVNEYEVEGRKAVWFMLDAGRHMAVGTTVENGFEAAVAAVSGLALAYTDRGYQVGLHTYNQPETEPLYPDVGQKQFLKIQRRLARLEPGQPDQSPLAAVLECEAWLRRDKPMVVFVTRTDRRADQLEDAVRRVLALNPEHPQPVLVIEPVGHHLVPGDEAGNAAARLIDHQSKPARSKLREMGAVVIPWNPHEQPLESLLFRGVMHHR